MEFYFYFYFLFFHHISINEEAGNTAGQQADWISYNFGLILL